MGRKRSIDTAIPRYCETQDKIKELKKLADEDKATIKAIMTKGKRDAFTSDGWTVSLKPRTTEDIDPDKLLNVIKTDWAKNNGSIQCPFIRTREYVDLEALEKAIYKGEVSQELLLQIDKCRVTKTSMVLYYSREKKEE